VRFFGASLITEDVKRLAFFYGDTLAADVSADDVFATVHVAGASLTIFSRAGMEAMAEGSAASVGSGSIILEFEVLDVDREYDRLAARGVPIVKPPTTQPWGRRSVWARDPDGNLINFYCEVPSS